MGGNSVAAAEQECWTKQYGIGPKGHRCNRRFNHTGVHGDEKYQWEIHLTLGPNGNAKAEVAKFKAVQQ